MIRILNCVADALTTGSGTPPEKLIVSLAGFATAEKYSVEPLSLVMRTSLKYCAMPAPSETVAWVMESVPALT